MQLARRIIVRGLFMLTEEFQFKSSEFELFCQFQAAFLTVRPKVHVSSLFEACFPVFEVFFQPY
ncbi:hypothetical protein AC781_07655 [Akkermansia glycaniphila]|nr:hypothetical protein AC781_07655 [Akkermansia glycaniphila]